MKLNEPWRLEIVIKIGEWVKEQVIVIVIM